MRHDGYYLACRWSKSKRALALKASTERAAVVKPFSTAVSNANALIGRNIKLFALQNNFQSVPSQNVTE